ncbi:MAG: hypothetical protein ACOWYE_03720, partial [Desulfatiglandales bacterium]
IFPLTWQPKGSCRRSGFPAHPVPSNGRKQRGVFFGVVQTLSTITAMFTHPVPSSLISGPLNRAHALVTSAVKRRFRGDGMMCGLP